MVDPAVKIRPATEADEAVLRELWEEFEQEVPWPLEEPETWADEWPDTLDDIRAGGVFLAEDGEGALGVARIESPVRGRAHIQLVHVRPRARRQGVAKALLRECARHAQEGDAAVVSLDVLTANESARIVWSHLGFEEHAKLMATPVQAFAARLENEDTGESRAVTHVQSDDEVSVERAVSQFIPRLEGPEVRTTDSWIRIADPVFDRDREAHGRFARELSDRLGAVTIALALEGEVVRFRIFERGRMVDEYLSVPTWYGELPKGDELALAANPTLVSRLTGASRDDVRRVARTAATPAELPPAAELFEQIARLMGLEA
jgi:ribosomal protein S18 acetylase RimI-like enzyme